MKHTASPKSKRILDDDLLVNCERVALKDLADSGDQVVAE